ncbi:MAG: CRTAC1 family protein [Acidobacteriota bacterium]
MKRRFIHRQRLLFLTAMLSLSVLLVVALFAFYKRPAERYRPEERAEGITSDLERQLPSDYPRVSFMEVAAKTGLPFRHFFDQRSTQLPEDMGSGAAWGDFDNDGDDDLFVANIVGPLTLDSQKRDNSPAICRLYRNNGDGTFTDVTQASGIMLRICGMAAAWGDVDGDGDLDLVVTSYPDLFLFRNNADSTFTEITSSSGLARFKGFWAGASWGDYDKDGDLDLYVCGYVQYHFDPADWSRVSLQFEAEVPYSLNPSSYRPERNLLFRNNGQGRFSEIAKTAGVDNPTGRSLAAAWCDFNGDGWLDLYVANDVSDNAMYQNSGNDRFQDVSHSAWVADYRGAMGLAVSDWDADGDFDIFVTHWLAQENALLKNMRIGSVGAAAGKMVFMDVADQEGLGQISLDYVKWGTSFLDYDNDGRADLLVVDGSTFQDPKDKRKLISMPHLLFWNREPDGFYEASKVSGSVFAQATVGRGAAFSDFDQDGDIDACVVNHEGPLWLLRNEGGNRKAWLKIKLEGKRNRFGLGAVVKVRTGARMQMQQVGAQPSYLSQNSLVLHFGLGSATSADEVIAEFLEGKTVRQQNVPVNQVLILKEP